jgi:hypothetical protein
MGACGRTDHCCWIVGRVCPHLEEGTVPGRRWACGLRRRLGSWAAVHASPEYRRDVRPFWARFRPDLDCGTWPPPGETCATCGQVGGGGDG